MRMRKVSLCFVGLVYGFGVAAHVSGGGDNERNENVAKSKGREYQVQLTLYETDKNGHRKVFGNPTTSTPEGEEFNLLSGGEGAFVVNQRVEWAKYGVCAHGMVRRLRGDQVDVDASIEVRQKKNDVADGEALTIVGQSVRTIRKVNLGKVVHIALDGESTRFLDMRITQVSSPQTVNERKTSKGRTESPAR